MMPRILLPVLVGVLVCTTSAQSQWWKVTTPEDIWLTQVGAAAHGAYLQHDASFQLPQAPMCCEPYQSTTAFSMSVSALIRQEITKYLRLNVRGTFMPVTGEFSREQSIFVTGATDGLTRSTLSTSMSYIGGEILADFRVANPVRLMAGVSIGTLTGATFSQQEELIVPGTGTFENGKRTRNVSTGADLQGVNTSQMGIVVGLGVDLPMTENHSVVITPELLYTIASKDNLTGQSWRTNSLRLGASVGFSLNAPEPPMPVERRREEFIDSLIVRIAPDAEEYRTRGFERIAIDTVVDPELVVITERSYRTDTVFLPKAPVINAAIKALAVEASGSTKDVFTINVSTQYVTEALPILPAVFFDAQSITISPRYHQVGSANEFDMKSVAPRTTAVHRDILNILGERLKNTPTMTVQLRGTADPTTENADCNLAQQRAIAVRDYLTRVWGIESSRITIVPPAASCAPDRVTRRLSEEGYAENRRVEISSSDLALLASVAKRRFNEARTVDPPRLKFDPNGTSTQYITDWKLEARTAGKTLFSKSGKGLPETVTQDLTIATADEMVSGQPVEVDLTVNGIRRSSASATAELAVRKDTANIELERLTLTLFEVASDEITAIAEEQIKNFVENVPAGSTVVVRGFADMLGNADFNKKLSQKRAESVCNTIRKYLRKRVDVQCNDITTDRFPPGIESYETPEERFLSRTVQIEVKKARK
jgi:outer membrane protein OmpA-like peptidoglycan-associated protein